MASFAIIRQDGEVDCIEGCISVQDVADTYGWPGNGRIEPWSEAEHGASLRHVFRSPTEQSGALDDVPGKASKSGKGDK